MIVKVKWIPWILLVGGVLAVFLCDGEDIFWGFVSAVIGGIWLFLQSRTTVPAKKSTPASAPKNTTPHVAASTVAPAPAATNAAVHKAQPAPADTQPKTKRCPSCGNIEQQDMFFCSKCGAKL